MKRAYLQKLIGLVGLGIILLIAILPAQAAVLSVSTSPSVKNIPLGSTAAITFNWLANDTSATGPVTVSSVAGFFRDSLFGNILLGTANTTISKSYTSTGASATVIFTETVVVPAEVIVRAQRLGLSRLVYERTFSPAGTMPTGAITLNITSPNVAGFSLSGMALRFDDASPLRLAALREEIGIEAQIGYVGAGLLKAVWEVADPTSTLGDPFFRPLAQVQQFLSVGDKAALKGPKLPTDQPGTYLVRLRITAPTLGFEAPILRYFVGAQTGSGQAPVAMQATSPPELYLLDKHTRFTWDPVAQAKAYRLEFYTKPDDISGFSLPDLSGPASGPSLASLSAAPATGLLLPGNKTHTPLSSAVLKHLRPNQGYYWRVLAVGKDGGVLAASPLREIRVP